MFEITQGIVIGRGHRAAAKPCQDAIAAASSTHGWAAANADGLGSKSLSEIGAHTNATVAVATTLADLGARPAAEIVRNAFAAAAAATEAAAMQLEVAPPELSATLTLAVVDLAAGELVVGSVGDGVQIVRDRAGTLHNISDGIPNEFANQVQPLRPGVEPLLTTLPLDAVDAVMLSSDGLEDLLLRRPADCRWPAPPLCHEILDAGPGKLDSLLRDPAVRRHTDDDSSLVVIRRNPGPAAVTVQLADGARLAVGPVEHVGEMRVRHATERPGVCLIELPVWVSGEIEALVAADPGGWWPHDVAWNRVAWPLAIAVNDDGVPGGLVIRHPGVDAASDEDILARSHVARAIIERLHAYNVAHGALSAGSFVPAPGAHMGAGSLTLVDVAPLFSAAPAEERRRADVAFLNGLEVRDHR